MDNMGKVQSVDRAAQILKCFSESRPELRLTEISSKLGLNKSTVHGIITTLKYHGLIDQDEKTQKYRLGTYLMKLGDLVSNSIDIVYIARPYIEDICNQVEETVHLGTLDNLEIVYIDKIESTQSMRISTYRGARNPAYCTGIGKAMMAYLNREFLNNVLPEKLTRYTPNTICSKEELLKELDKIRETGFAFDNEERSVGLFCVAVPIFNHLGKVNYALSVSGPKVRMNGAKIERTKRLLKKAADEISHKIGFVGWERRFTMINNFIWKL